MTDEIGPSADDAAMIRRTSATHRVIKGRRWRVSDPALGEPLRQHLVDELMHARRAVKSALEAEQEDALATARGRVNDAKIALGERGPKWWEPMSIDEIDLRTSAFARAIGERLGELDERQVRSLLRLPDVSPDQAS